LHDAIRHGMAALKQAAIPRRGVRLSIDVDPMNLL
jgi:hypothetical protein